MTAGEIAQQIAQRSNGQPRSDGRGGFFVICPCHEDRRASLHISTGKRGCVVLHCHANCGTADILAACGLSFHDLFNDRTATRRGRPTAEYAYVDLDHHHRFTVLRYGDGKNKEFCVVRAGEDGSPVLNAQGLGRLLYHAPEVAAAVLAGKETYVCEGEKDADAMRRAYGVVATTNPFGATVWASDAQRHGYCQLLRGGKIVIVQHIDAKGTQRTKQILASLDGVAASLRVIQAAAGNDAYDHIVAGMGLDQFVDVSLAACRIADDGTFAALPNALFEAASVYNLSHLEHRLLMEIGRQTVRRENGRTTWQSRPLASSWLACCAGDASPSSVRESLKRMRDAHMILVDDPQPGQALRLRINGDFSAWRPLPSRSSKAVL